MNARSVLGLVLAGVLCCSVVARGEGYGIELYAQLSGMTWKETFPTGETLEEEGALIGVGGIGRFEEDPFRLRVRAEVLAGELDYDGYLQFEDGALVPYRSETEYVWFNVSADLAMTVVESDAFALAPFVGLGAKAWLRDVGAGSSYGYEENWRSAVIILGIETRHAFGDASELTASVFVNVPIDNEVTYDLHAFEAGGDVDVEPGTETSVGVEVSYLYDMWYVAAFVETLEFSESDLDTRFEQYLQPDSEAVFVGLRAGVRM